MTRSKSAEVWEGILGHVRQKSWVKLAKCFVLTWREPLAGASVPVLLRKERRHAVSGRSSIK